MLLARLAPLSSVVVLATAFPALGAPTYVQARVGTGVDTRQFSGASTAGNAILVCVGWPGGTSPVTDSAGNSYTYVGQAVRAGHVYELHYATTIDAGASPITVRANGNDELAIVEYAGLDPSSPVAAFAPSVGTSIAMDSGFLAPPDAGDLLFTCALHHGGLVSVDPSLTVRGGDLWTAVAERQLSTPSPVATTHTGNSVDNWHILTAVLAPPRAIGQDGGATAAPDGGLPGARLTDVGCDCSAAGRLVGAWGAMLAWLLARAARRVNAGLAAPA